MHEGVRKAKSMRNTPDRSSIADHNEMREHMTDQMIGSAAQMKKIAQQFGTTIKYEGVVIGIGLIK